MQDEHRHTQIAPHFKSLRFRKEEYEINIIIMMSHLFRTIDYLIDKLLYIEMILIYCACYKPNNMADQQQIKTRLL